MYLEHFGFRVLPFENVPDPAFFFNAGEYQRILRRITSAVGAGRGLMVVAGPIGSGKTTLSQKIMADLPAGTVHLWLAEPPGTDRELFQMLLQRLGSRFNWASRVLALGLLRDRLLELHAGQGRCLLIVDESHKFTDEGLEAIRLLNNLEQGAAKLMQVLMLGQEELTGMLARAGREAFRQRITNMEVLGRMTPPQVHDYVRHRLRIAGGEPGIFPDPVLGAIAEAAAGIPRLTNSLCDRALRNAFEGGKRVVDTRDLLQAAEELGVYAKAFHFLVKREQTETRRQTPPAAVPALQPFRIESVPSEPKPATIEHGETLPWTLPPLERIVPLPESAAPTTESEVSAETPQRPLLMPLALLAGGIAALGASLFFYCSRATALYGGDCLSHLVRDIVPW